MFTWLSNNSGNNNDLGIYLAFKLISINEETSMLPLQLCVKYKDTVFSLPHLAIENDILLSIGSPSEEADRKTGQLTLHCIKSMYIDIKVQPALFCNQFACSICLCLLRWNQNSQVEDENRTFSLQAP